MHICMYVYIYIYSYCCVGSYGEMYLAGIKYIIPQNKEKLKKGKLYTTKLIFRAEN